MRECETAAMLRRQPALCVVAAVYFVGLVLLCLTPNSLVGRAAVAVRRVAPVLSTPAAEMILGVILFVPVGALLVLITGRRRWIAVIAIGALASCWLRLAEMVWMPRERIDAGSVMPHIGGTALGVLIVVVALAVRNRSAARRSRTGVPVVAQRS